MDFFSLDGEARKLAFISTELRSAGVKVVVFASSQSESDKGYGNVFTMNDHMPINFINIITSEIVLYIFLTSSD